MGQILGTRSLLDQLEAAGKTPEECMEKALGKQTKRVQASAKLLCPVNHGELRNSIKTAVMQENGTVTGVVYTNKSYAPYVEFGTGPKGNEDHNGVSPEISLSYKQKPWWIHESQITREESERYHLFQIDTPQGAFYQTSGQPAQPFLYPALKTNEETIVNGVREELHHQLMRAIREGRRND